ncbi:serine/threonine protein kinase [Filimonas lacunae]|uniref:Serine/threonine protein kinase n=1 Tax=Filimonas lacunae TaxID=477680 RepID=A0A173MBB2_9BACT|nr:leucine-rich repeat-containing protein kinase family protein [Filimonas lacunae]BAV04816.1 serine/threonine protein kinase [Filimonas lacunae]SIT34721.1 serine/threonine protein kinase [Filimonas lacunae]
MNTLQQLLSGELAGAKRVKLACGLTEFPQELFQLADTLEILDLSGNRLSDLPADFDRLHKLKILFCSDNLFTVFPEVLSRCSLLEMVGFKSNRIAVIPEAAFPPQLRWLILTNNCLEKIPAAIGQCIRLQKCMLAGNRLTGLPDEMRYCHNLQLLRISANEMATLPDWLFTLPRLSWLAMAGNPCCHQPAVTAPEWIHWNELEVTHQLGEGASGFVSTGNWHKHIQQQREIAVKLFKGEVTSDGLPQEEMNATVAAGTHVNLVQVLGQISHHPDQKKGLVLNLIPATFANLGNPPDFDTCTRDTFAAGTAFTIDTMLAVARALASVGAHLHARGIMHGDLYAHNILIDKAGGVLLVDYGAATMYNRAAVHAAAIERLEVRAYGCLLDDLLLHAAPEPAQQERRDGLLALRDACMQEQVLLRPSFETLVQQLG